MMPRLGSSKLVSTWILIVLGASIFAAVDGGWLASHAALAPARIWRGEVWRLVTWVFIEPAPMSLVFTCTAIYKFGGELAPRWGDRRLRKFVAELVIAGAVIACSTAFLSDRAWYMFRIGGWVVGDVLVIAWARQYPTAVLRYGLLELHGRHLIWFTVGFTVLLAIYSGPFATMPELVACLGAAVYPLDRLRRA